ncbi:hypothetical protein BKG96_10630, partial [Rodentibacter caecimuris]
FNGDVLWLLGDAGVGKSHLLGDITSQRIKQGKPSLLLLGQDFIEVSNVWDQILNKQLNLKNSPKEFLSALDSIAESQNERVLLSIDALNEGVGKDLWNNQLNGFIDLLRNYPNIGLVLSVRTTYQAVIHQSLTQEIKNNICTIYHYGFSDMEFEAIQSFFQYYNLALPSTPLLNPEFSNPLYLKLLCESLIKQGLHTIPKGYKGINQVISSYIQGVEKSISKQLDEDEGLHLVQRAIHVIAQLALHKESLEYIPVKRAIAKELKDDISESDSKKFIDYLIKEGVLTKNIYYSGEKEIVYFSYERIGDYQKANLILNNISSQSDLQNWLNTKDGSYIFRKPYSHRGLIEALAVLIPERLSCELFDIVNFENQHEQELLAEIILKSIIWRNSKLNNIENIIQFIKDNLSEYSYELWIDTLYQLSSELEHSFNILYIHKRLYALSLADRDEKWTTFISVDLNECPAIQRLLLWCCKYSQTSKIESESRLLSAIAVSWLLGSTNIKQRNEAMKSLASLLLNHIEIGHQLYIEFANVNDPYILDGVLYSIYHAILYSEELNGLKELALEVYRQLFDISSDKEIYPNVLVRDSARNIIEFALTYLDKAYSEHEIINIRSKITPPYRSNFPDQLPSTELIDKTYTSQSQKVIIHSMTTEYGRGMCAYGDFGRYTFQSALSKWKRHHVEEQLIDIDLLSNYACELIFKKFGYDDKKHSEFDSRNRSFYRRENKVERIGKKYQWLALYEILARVMDNIQAPKECYRKNSPLCWVTDLKDFYLPRANIEITSPVLNNNWDEYSSQIPDIDSDKCCFGEVSDWINDTATLPNIPDMLEIKINGEFWVALERHDNLENTPEFGEENHINTKNLWFQIRSYLIPKRSFSKAKKWLSQQDFMGRWMPEGVEHYNANLQNSLAIRDKASYQPSWKLIEQDKYHSSLLPEQKFKVLPTAEEYIWEYSHGNDGENIYAPCYFIFTSMGMNISHKKGFFVNKGKELVCFNPIINGRRGNMILVKKDALLEFLNKNNLQIIWTTLGEKLAWNSIHDIYEQRLNISGCYYFDRKNNIDGTLNTYISK